MATYYGNRDRVHFFPRISSLFAFLLFWGSVCFPLTRQNRYFLLGFDLSSQDLRYMRALVASQAVEATEKEGSITHVVLQMGVGSMAAAVVGYFTARFGVSNGSAWDVKSSWNVLGIQKGFGARLLDCYWVGSLDFNFLGNKGVFH